MLKGKIKMQKVKCQNETTVTAQRLINLNS